jgi:carbamoyl-phosphate synthase small subunit
MTSLPGVLVLADGTVFHGVSVGVPGCVVGELVFNTAATGYQEIFTDPSYARQLLMLTTAHVGNTGCNLTDHESSRVWAAGVILHEVSEKASHYQANCSLPEWLTQHGVVGLCGVDTRALTHHIRERGALNACIATDGRSVAEALQCAQQCPSLSGQDLAKVVTRTAIGPWTANPFLAKCNKRVVVYDFGVKDSILHALSQLGCDITLVPAQTPAHEVLSLAPDGVVLSNGPGDPAACDYAISETKILLNASMPLFGICLGFQILGLACGAQTIKMKFGHHGANHPVIELADRRRVLITSQNHGFALDEATLPDCLIPTHRSLFDHSLQGIIHRDKPALGFQGHPEAGPGPHDALGLFQEFISMMG